MTSTRMSRRAFAGAALSGAAALATTAVLPAHRAAAPPASPTSLPVLDPVALRAAIDDLEHPPSTAAQLRVGGTAGRWHGTSGVADIRTRRPVTARDKVRIGSVTKVFVATVVLQLVAEDRLGVDTPARRVLPELLPTRFAAVTVAHLLNHTSGLPDHGGAVAAFPAAVESVQRQVATISKGASRPGRHSSAAAGIRLAVR